MDNIKSKAKQSKAKQSKAKQSRAEQSRTYDILRVVATILVVIGHCTYLKISTSYGGCDYSYLFSNTSIAFKLLSKLVEFIYIFHMPLFIALSGALFEKSLMKGHYPSFKQLVNKKAKNLLIPFIVVTLLYSTPIKFLSGYFEGSTNFIKDIFVGQILIQGNTHLWYLLTLFVIFVVGYLCLKNSGVKQSILLLFLIALSLGSGKIGIKLVSYVFQFTLWFYVGMLFEKNRSIFEDTFSDIKFRLLLADIVLYGIYEIANHFLIPFPIKIIMKVEKIILSGLLCLTVYMISYFVMKSKIFNSRVFNVLRRDSFGIYLYSDPLNYLILMVGASLFGGELWTNNLYSVAFYLFRILVTLGISICLTEVLKKCKIKYIC